jgi:cytochrome P450
MSFLRHIPVRTSPWQKKETTRHVLEDMLFDANVGFSVESETAAERRPSFTHTFLETKQDADDRMQTRLGELDEARHVVGLMAIAGALTIGSPLQSYLLAMCHYPEWQRKLQHEVDCKLRGRCPEWEDRERLPLLRAVVKEVIRWRPPVPTGIPHAIEKDDIFNGFFIPAGATIHALEW